MQPVTDQTDQKEDGDEMMQGPSIDANGRLEGRFNNVEAPMPAPAPPPREERLDLEARPRAPVEERMQTYRAELQKRSDRPWALKLMLGAMLLGVISLGAFVYFKPKLDLPTIPDGVRPSGIVDQLTSTEAAPIIISSTPTGATITIGGKNVGETPWAGENRWVGQTAVTLKLPGYKTWEGKLEGGEPKTLDITLKK
jgi:hypothetical protein